MSDELEDRLRDSLSQRAGTITVEPPSLEAVTARGARKARRDRVALVVGSAAVVVVLIAGALALRPHSSQGPAISFSSDPTTPSVADGDGADGTSSSSQEGAQLEAAAIDVLAAHALSRSAAPVTYYYGPSSRSADVRLANAKGLRVSINQGTYPGPVAPTSICFFSVAYRSESLPSDYTASSKSTNNHTELCVVGSSSPAQFIDIWTDGDAPIPLADLETSALQLLARSPIQGG